MKTFRDLGLSDSLCKALDDLKFTNPTEIQEKSIPLLLAPGQVDFLGQAQTGTGKTLAFGLPLLQKIDTKKKAAQALIVAPTRELAHQIFDALEQANKYTKASMALIYGGVPMQNQIRNLKRGAQIIIGTPGRLQDHLRRKTLSLTSIHTLVLDEADIMLDMGFKEDIEAILQYAPKERNIWLFSATVKSGVNSIMRSHMKDTQSISASKKQVGATNVTQQYVIVNSRHRLAALRRFIDTTPEFYGFVFSPTKVLAGEVADQLNRLGYKASALHGDMSQMQRNRVVEQFKKKKVMILVATDVAARGIDIPDITHVINYSLPDDLESYVHRVGRTGRAGKTGIAITFTSPAGIRRIRVLERRFQCKIDPVDVPSNEALLLLQTKHAAELLTTRSEQKKADEAEYAKELRKLVESYDKDALSNVVFSLLNDKFFRRVKREEDIVFTPISKMNLDQMVHNSEEEVIVYQGSDDGITKGHLLSFITDRAEVAKNNLMKIKVLKRRAFIKLTGGTASKVAQLLRSTGLNGRKVRASVSIDDGGDSRPQRRRGNDSRGGGGFRGNRGNSGGGGRGRGGRQRRR